MYFCTKKKNAFEITLFILPSDAVIDILGTI